MTTGPIHPKDKAIPNILACNKRTPKYVKQKLITLKGKTDYSAITVGYFNISLSLMIILIDN